MSVVGVTNVELSGEASLLTDSFSLVVFFESLENLPDDLCWRVVYVGDPNDKTKDQELGSYTVGPISRGTSRFGCTASAPDFSLIDKDNIEGFSILFLIASYRNQDFVRVGWYVHNYFPDADNMEKPPDVDTMTVEEMLIQMRRRILIEAPRVTRFHIVWHETPTSSSSLSVPDGLANTNGMAIDVEADSESMEHATAPSDNQAMGRTNVHGHPMISCTQQQSTPYTIISGPSINATNPAVETHATNPALYSSISSSSSAQQSSVPCNAIQFSTTSSTPLPDCELETFPSCDDFFPPPDPPHVPSTSLEGKDLYHPYNTLYSNNDTASFVAQEDTEMTG